MSVERKSIIDTLIPSSFNRRDILNKISQHNTGYPEANGISEQVNLYVIALGLEQVNHPRQDIKRLARVFGKPLAVKMCSEVDGIIEKIKLRGDSLVGDNIYSKELYSKEFKNQWEIRMQELKEKESNIIMPITADQINNTFTYWEQRFDKSNKQNKECITKKIKNNSRLKGIEIGLRIKKNLSESETHDIEKANKKESRSNKALQLVSDLLIKLPIWFEIQKQLNDYAKFKRKQGIEVTVNDLTDLAKSIGKYYKINNDKNPFVQNTELSGSLTKSTGLNVVSEIGRNYLGYSAYGFMLIDPHFRKFVDDIGSGYSISTALLATLSVLYLRYQSDKKALLKSNYSSYLPQTLIYNFRNISNNSSNYLDKQKNAEISASIGSLMNLSSALHPFYWPLIFGNYPYSTVAYIASLSADQLPYIISNQTYSKNKNLKN